jgi:hypothetical protein
MIGLLVRETVALIRAYRCEHEWSPINAVEEQCEHCRIIATADGKRNLAAMAARYLGRRQTA